MVQNVCCEFLHTSHINSKSFSLHRDLCRMLVLLLLLLCECECMQFASAYKPHRRRKNTRTNFCYGSLEQSFIISHFLFTQLFVYSGSIFSFVWLLLHQNSIPLRLSFCISLCLFRSLHISILLLRLLLLLLLFLFNRLVFSFFLDISFAQRVYAIYLFSIVQY